jgi:DNA-binding SARP family transcriptional activator
MTASASVEVRLIGPVRVLVDGAGVDLGSPQQKLLIALLAESPGRPLPTERVVELLWDGTPPNSARQLLHGMMSDLRKRVGAELLPDGRRVGYSLTVTDSQVDLLSLRAAVRQSRGFVETGDDRTAHALLSEHLTPVIRDGVTVKPELLAGLYGNWASAFRQRWEDEIYDAVLLLCDVEVRLGRHEAAFPRLQRLVAARPTHSSAVGLLMLALYRAGREVDAGAVYSNHFSTFKKTVGVEPRRDVQDLHLKILNRDPALDPPTPSALIPAPRRRSTEDRKSVPRQLPAGPAVFTGRVDAMAQLDTLLPDHSPAALVAPRR